MIWWQMFTWRCNKIMTHGMVCIKLLRMMTCGIIGWMKVWWMKCEQMKGWIICKLHHMMSRCHRRWNVSMTCGATLIHKLWWPTWLVVKIAKDPSVKMTPIKVALSKRTYPRLYLGQVGQRPFGVLFEQFSLSKRSCFLVVYIYPNLQMKISKVNF